MSENENESASKRQKLCDQEKAGDHPLMQEGNIAAQTLHSSSKVVDSEFQSSIPVLQMYEDDLVEPNLNVSMPPVVSGPQCDKERNPLFVTRVSFTCHI
jgi:hypothetical protein